jgi:mono/diheme cytochrome c family protein
MRPHPPLQHTAGYVLPLHRCQPLRTSRFVTWIALFYCLGVLVSSGLAAITAEQRKQLQELQTATRDAGKMYTEQRYAEAAAEITGIQQKLLKLLESKDADLQKEARKIFSSLQKAHALLELEGAELEALPSWEEITTREMAPQAASTGTVSFKDDVAPWMVNLCGNCHINNSRGNFSLATYNDLIKGSTAGKVLFPGAEQGNRIIELIENGDMPRGGGKLTEAQLTAFRKWIIEGARFDGPDPTARLNTFAKGVENQPPAAMQVKAASGNETVSFARDIAPILMENCNGCHIAGRQASGNFRMDTFAQLLRGGDSGAVIASGKATESLIVKKLKGESGQRMPAGGRPALSSEKIELISTWINEGAPYDGSTPDTNIETVVNQSWAARASHEELFARRQQRALERWRRVLPNDDPATAKSDQAFVLGNVSPARIDEIQKQIDRALTQVGKQLGAPTNGPLIKGGLAVFVLKSRYDYSEFGKMTESRELPKEWQGHWQANPLDVYAVLANDNNAEEKQQSAQALQVVTGAYLGSFNGVPTWFAEGVARNLVLTANRRSDPRVVAWQQAMPLAILKVDRAETLLENRLDEESAGLVGMGLTSFMMDRSNRRRFDALLNQLREGKSFNDAASASFAPPAAIIKSWIGK